MNYAEIIENIFKIDQTLRKERLYSIKTLLEFNKSTARIIRDLYNKFGAPKEREYKLELINNYLILLSHIDDVALTKKILKELIQNCPNINRENVAIVLDNIRVRLNKKQLYGTALKIKKSKNGALASIPLPILNPKKVDYRRKNFGLATTLEEYVQHSNEILKLIKK